MSKHVTWPKRIRGECLTPGAVYHIEIKPKQVGVNVRLPISLSIGRTEAKEMENKIHDALEEILAPFFS